MRLPIPVLTVLLLAAGPAAAQERRFAFEAMTGPSGPPAITSVVCGDLDGDGSDDVVLDGQVFLAQPDGGLAAVGTALDTTGWLVFLGHATPDGDLDAFTWASGTEELSVHPGDGAGGFLAPTIVPLAALPRAVADVDGNGFDDVVGVAEEAGDTVLVVALADGLGGFDVSSTSLGIPSGFGLGLDALVVGRFDDDASPDIALAADGAPGEIDLQILLGDGTGGFVPASTATADAPSSAVPVDLGAADLDGDGVDELVLSFATLQVFADDGTGTFVLVAEPGPITWGMARPDFGDVDGDGSLDIVAFENSFPEDVDDATFAVLLNDGGWSFTVREQAVGAGFASGALLHLDGDGVLDLAATFSDPAGLLTFLGDGTGGFGPDPRIAGGAGVADEGRRVLLADLDGDGRLDVVTGRESLDVRLSDGAAGLLPPVVHPVGGLFPVRVLRAADLDRDGRQDVVAGGTGVQGWLGDGAGGLDGATPSVFSSAEALDVGDLDGDAVTDAVAAGAPVGVAAMSVFLGDGTGAFPAELPVSLPADAGPDDLHLADLDQDGDLDVVLVGDVVLRTLLNDGTGVLAGQDVVPTGSPGTALAVGDTNGDTVPDAVVIRANEALRALVGDGAGNMSNVQTLGVGVDGPVELVDVDGDGRLDVVASSDRGTFFVSAVGDGTGRFGDVRGTASWAERDAVGVGHLDAGDVDGDAVPDVVQIAGGDADVVFHPDLLASPRWLDLGGALPGTGAPLVLAGEGELLAGTPAELRVSGGHTAPFVWLVLGLTELAAPFKGGQLVPAPDVLATVPVDARGVAVIATTWPAGLSGLQLFAQAWRDDPQGVAGFAASNALRLDVP